MGSAARLGLLEDEVARQIKDIAREAGGRILEIADEPTQASRKEDGSPVTRADMAAHHAICSALRAAFEDVPVVSEEGDPDLLEEVDPGLFWLVDPLDGTKEFISGTGEYTVNIALVEEGSPLLGVVYAPVIDVLYSARSGTGAWKETAEGGQAQRIVCGSTGPLKATVSRSHRSADVDELLERLGVRETVPCGSSLKICAVAEGRADIYPRLGPTWLWDTAAGAAVAREAGCRVVDLEGRPLTYRPERAMKHHGFVVYCPERCAWPPET